MLNYFSQTLCKRALFQAKSHPNQLEQRITWTYKLNTRSSSEKNFQQKHRQPLSSIEQLRKPRRPLDNLQYQNQFYSFYELIKRMDQERLRIKLDMRKILMKSKLRQVKIKQIKHFKQMEGKVMKQREQKQKFQQAKYKKQENMNKRDLLELLAVFVCYKQLEAKIKGIWQAFQFKSTVDKIQESYVEGSSVSEEMSKIIEKDSNKRVKLIAGSPRLGKSTSVQKFLKQQVEKGQVVYYYTFQSFEKSKHILTGLKEIINLLYGVRSKFTSKDYEGKKVKLVIDDINKLQRLSNEAFCGFMYFAYAFADNKNIGLVMISSSQSFVQKVSDSSFDKGGQLYIVQTQPTNQFMANLFMKRISLQKYYNIAFDAGFTRRMIKTMGLMEVQKMTKYSIMEEFKRFREEDLVELTDKVIKIRKKVKKLKQEYLQVNVKRLNWLLMATKILDARSDRVIQQLKLENLATFFKPSLLRMLKFVSIGTTDKQEDKAKSSS